MHAFARFLISSINFTRCSSLTGCHTLRGSVNKRDINGIHWQQTCLTWAFNTSSLNDPGNPPPNISHKAILLHANESEVLWCELEIEPYYIRWRVDEAAKPTCWPTRWVNSRMVPKSRSVWDELGGGSRFLSSDSRQSSEFEFPTLVAGIDELINVFEDVQDFWTVGISFSD